MEEIAGKNAIQFMLMIYLDRKPLGEAKLTQDYSGFGVSRQKRHLLAGAKPQRSPSAPGRKARSQTLQSLETASGILHRLEVRTHA